MKALLAAVLLLGVCARAEDPASVFSGIGASLGRDPRVTARLTYDRAKAAAGGLIFAVERASPADDEALRLSEAVVAASGGLMSRAAQAARAHGVPCLLLPRARWQRGALVVDVPTFGAPAPGAGGLRVSRVENMQSRVIGEGEVVTVDPAQGLLTLYAPERQQAELDLAQAVRAFEGLRDGLCLQQWFAARAEEGGAALALRLAEELGERVAAGAVAAEDADSALRGVRQQLSEAQRRELDAGARALAARLAEDESQALAQAGLDLKDAATESAAARIANDAGARWKRLATLARALGASPSGAAYSSFSAEARRRLAALRGKHGDWRDAAAAAGAAQPASARLPGALYRRFAEQAGLDAPLRDIFDDASLDLRRKSARAQALFGQAELDESSAVGRDALAALPAGGLFLVETDQRALPFVPRERFLAALKEAWASYWEPAPLGRRLRSGEALSADVLVEAEAPAEVSGVVFSREPGTGRRERVLVEAVWGEPEGLASGETAADEYAVDRRTGREVLPVVVADKRVRFSYDAAKGAVAPEPVAPGPSLARCLSSERLERLARVARALDAQLGEAVEARYEWAGGKLLVLSAKPLH